MTNLSRKSLGMSMLVCIMFTASWFAARVLTPRHGMGQEISLERTVPTAFGDWKQLENGVEQTSLSVAADGTLTEEQPYGQVVMRTYENSQGARVMLALGYATEQTQEVKIHRPEVCYVAQGFKVLDDRAVDLPQNYLRRDIHARRLLMRNSSRLEAVTYWVRIGAEYPRGGINTRLAILKYGLTGHIPDAILVRASTILMDENETPKGFNQQERFLADLVNSMPRGTATMLVGKQL